MTDLVVVLAMGAITYGSRVTFLVHQGPVPSGILRRFLDRFPLALFVSLAASILIGPGSDVDLRFGLAAIAGGVGGGVLGRRSLYGVIGLGFAAYWLARLLAG